MNKFRPPEPLVFEGNLSEQWDRWKQQLELYLMATESTEKAQAIDPNINLPNVYWETRPRNLQYFYVFQRGR